MQNDNVYQSALETATPPADPGKQKELHDAHFNYRQVIVEAIYAMVTCRPDRSFAVTKLSQYSASPAEIHYKAARQLMKYLALTKTRGIAYWRKRLLQTLPHTPNESCISKSEILHTIPHHVAADQSHSFVDADWGGDGSHRQSVTVLMVILAGGIIAYKTKFQSSVSLSSTEAKFIAEAGKMALYLRSILTELSFPQYIPMIIYENNMGALFMEIADQPTKRTRHMDTKLFVLQD